MKKLNLTKNKILRSLDMKEKNKMNRPKLKVILYLKNYKLKKKKFKMKLRRKKRNLL